MNTGRESAGAGGDLDRAAADLTPLLRWLGQQPEARQLELLCPEHPDPSRGSPTTRAVQLEVCLAALPASGYLELVAGGTTSIVVRLDGCTDSRAAMRTTGAANDLLAACGRVERVAVQRAAPEGARRRTLHLVRALPVPRRALLLLGGGGVPGAPTRPSTERARMLAALRVLSVGGTGPDRLAELAAPSAVLSVTGCTACEVCVRACPTDALRIHRLADADDPAAAHVSLRQLPADCLDCDRCVELCPQGALTVTGQHSWSDLLSWVPRVVMAQTTATCARCGAGFALCAPDGGAGELCDVCTYRRANPFGSMVVPAALR